MSIPRYSAELKVVLAIVLLFLGWLLAAMIPKSETSWDRASSSFLSMKHNSSSGNSKDVAESLDSNDAEHLANRLENRKGLDHSRTSDSDYKILWDSEKKNWDSEKREIIINDQSSLFAPPLETDSISPFKEGDKGLTSDETEPTDSQSWADELKIASPALPDIQPGERPKWDDPVQIGDSDGEEGVTNGIPDALAPPTEPLAHDFFTSTDKADPVIADAPSEDFVKEDTTETIASSETTQTDSVSEDVEGEIVTSPSLPKEETNVVRHNEEENKMDTSSPLYSLPNKRPPEQASAKPVENRNEPKVVTETLLPFKQLTPSSRPMEDPPSAIRTAEHSALPNEKAPIRQATGLVPYESTSNGGNDVVSNLKPSGKPSLGRPMSVAIYVVEGGNETWSAIAQKFNLTPEETTRYAEINGSRIHSDMTVSQGMKLMLPKR